MARAMAPRRALAGLVLFALLLAQWPAARAGDLKIIFAQYTPPYVLEDGSGILPEIVRGALGASGYTVTPVCVPIGRGLKMFVNRQVDGTSIIKEGAAGAAQYSADFMQYHNGAFALKSRHLSIRGFDDLKDKSVLAFQHANQYLGGEFGAAVAANPRYREVARQEGQVRMLLLGRADVIVMDRSIFLYYWRKFQPGVKGVGAEDYDAFDLFPATPYRAAFEDAAVRDAFDQGIAAMRKDGRYDAIYQKYAARYLVVQ